MQLHNQQNFLHGVQRRFSREDNVDPRFFYTLQNARLYKRGETGKVTRIKGHVEFASDGDYSNVLDIITYKDMFIVFYEDDGFCIDIFNEEGVRVKNFEYTGTSTDTGKLIVSDQSIFIAPHNKIIYYNDGDWLFSDYISQAPIISSIETVDDSVKGVGTIQITSGASVSSGRKASGYIAIIRNNTQPGQRDRIKVKFGDHETAYVTVNYEDTVNVIRDKLFDAINNVSGISTNWVVSKGIHTTTANEIWFTAKTAGDDFNDVPISILFDPEAETRFSIVDSLTGNALFEGIPAADLLSDVTIISSRTTSGGVDPVQFDGHLVIGIETINSVIQTENIFHDDTDVEIAQKIENALTGDQYFSKLYDCTRSAATITITAKRGGARYNSSITLNAVSGGERTELNFLASVNNISGGKDSSLNGTLEYFQDYWYMVRYRYLDGHVTQTGFPVHINSGTASSIQLTVDVSATDIDGTRPRIEVFRKKSYGDFYLIGSVKPSGSTLTYVDNGESEQGVLQQRFNIWNKSHKTHEIVDNNYVRANIEYFDEDFTWSEDFTITAVSSDDTKQLPKSSIVDIYVRPQFMDGTRGFHKKIGSLNVDSYGQKLQISQNSVVTSSDRSIVDLGFYADYKPQGSEFTYPFDSPELSNINMHTIGEPDLYPSKARIFFGFKYIEVRTASNQAYVRVGDWDLSGREDAVVSIGRFTETGPVGGMPETTKIQVGTVMHDYVLIAAQPDPTASGEYIGIYKLAMFDSLRDAISTGDLRLRLRSKQFLAHGGRRGTDNAALPPQTLGETLTGWWSDGRLMTRTRSGLRAVNTPDNRQTRIRTMGLTPESQQLLTPNRDLGGAGDRTTGRTGVVPVGELGVGPSGGSSVINEDTLFDITVTVSSLVDQSAPYNEIDLTPDNRIMSPPDSKIYLELEASPFDEVENSSLSFHGLRRSYSQVGLDLSAFGTRLRYEFVNFTPVSDATKTHQQSDYVDGKMYHRLSWKNAVFDLIGWNSLRGFEGLIYLGKKSNSVGTVTLGLTGYEDYDNANLNYVSLANYNLYEGIILDTDMNIVRKKFPTQLVWSEPLVEGNLYSGGRNIRPENFFNISEENGEIQEIVSLGNSLYVFCQKGVAQINVGEIITQQRSGELFVDGSQVLTNYRWVLDFLHDIKPRTILRYKHSIYFTDGYDLYRISDGVENLTNGIIPLDSGSVYTAFIDNVHAEYVLCDLTNGYSWVYGLESAMWYGPFTFVSKKGSNMRKLTIAQVGNKLMKLNVGNTFDGQPYKTLIQSVGNDTEESFQHKNFRKFYIGSNNDSSAVFKYGLDPDDLVSINFNSMKDFGGHKHVGVKASEQNGRKIFWDIETYDSDFELTDISWLYRIRSRR